MFKNFKKNNGFTLVEMIVSLAIFSVVAVVALGALVKIISANHKAQSLQSALTNLNFGLESMSRELREARTYHCDASTDPTGYGGTITAKGCQIISSGDAVIAFISAKRDSTKTCNLVYVYRFVTQGGQKLLQKAEQRACGESAGASSDPALVTTFSNVLSPENVVIQDYSLSVGPYSASTPNNLANEYPYVFIHVSGYAGEREKDKTYFDIQTMVSSRTPQT
jgi:prepilin-type N-terminal cleavage/methylation domain-containing protein